MMRFWGWVLAILVSGGLGADVRAQSAYDTMLNYSLMEESRCAGGGGAWSGMTCSGGSSGGGLTSEDLTALGNAIGSWHQKEMRKATCLMIVEVARDAKEFAALMVAHVGAYNPPEIHVFREYGRYHRNGGGPLLLTHGYTQMLIGHSLDNRIRRGEIPRSARCTNIDYAEKQFKLVASATRTVSPTQQVVYALSGDQAEIAQIVGP
ncbi:MULTISPECIES: hypothetical protein [Roseobacteraceae]|uniref:hypothetical protein n=1 Tax=Roseobacteraceae TaxID=2854170 RepID=UPI003297B941